MKYRMKIVRRVVQYENVEAGSIEEAKEKAKSVPIMQHSTDTEITLDKFQPDIITAIEVVIRRVPIDSYIRRMDVVNAVSKISETGRDELYDIVSDYFNKQAMLENWKIEYLNKGNIAYKRLKK